MSWRPTGRFGHRAECGERQDWHPFEVVGRLVDVQLMTPIVCEVICDFELIGRGARTRCGELHDADSMALEAISRYEDQHGEIENDDIGRSVGLAINQWGHQCMHKCTNLTPESRLRLMSKFLGRALVFHEQRSAQ